MIKHQGGCHCGKISFKTEYDPMIVTQCNCARCRKLFGAVGLYTVFGSSEVEISGQTKIYDFIGGSGQPMHLHSCPECGTRICAFADSFDGFIFLIVGSFADSRQFLPRIEYFTNYKLDWLKHDGCIQESFGEAAVMERLQALMENMDQRD